MQKMGSALILIILGLIVLGFPLLGLIPFSLITGFIVLILGIGLILGGIAEMGESAGMGILEVILGVIALILGIGFDIQPCIIQLCSRIIGLHSWPVLDSCRYNWSNFKSRRKQMERSYSHHNRYNIPDRGSIHSKSNVFRNFNWSMVINYRYFNAFHERLKQIKISNTLSYFFIFFTKFSRNF